jgi:type IV pilus assembly protein PilA
MRSGAGGFTLVELMIATAIVAVLAALSIEATLDYAIRAQAAEGLNLAMPVQTAVTDYYVQHGTWPTAVTGGGSGLNLLQQPSGNYVSSINVNTGSILITYGGHVNAAVANKTLSLNAYTLPTGEVLWMCGHNSTAPPGSTPVGTGVTTMPNRYLPRACQL